MKERRRVENKKSIDACGIAIIAISILTAAPAEAALLHGYVGETNVGSQQQVILNSSLRQQESALRPDSFPSELQGSWQCVSVVTDSLVDTVSVGQKVVSRMDFVKTADGRVVARFVQPGWTEAQESVTAFSSTQYQMDKTNYFYGDGSAGSWAARSRDRYQLLEQDRMIAESEVDQYVGGQYVGRYKTRSTLTRARTGMENVALHPVPDPDDLSGDRLFK